MSTFATTSTLVQEALLLDVHVAIPQGATIQKSRTYVFDKPGYYLISATSRNEVIDEPRKEDDRIMPLANENASQVWVLIAPSGGHLDTAQVKSGLPPNG